MEGIVLTAVLVEGLEATTLTVCCFGGEVEWDCVEVPVEVV